MTDIPIRTKPVPYCPRCGAKMTLRRPYPGQTWQYPDCKARRGILPNGQPEPADDEVVLSITGEK